jgi:hypothetical protein
MTSREASVSQPRTPRSRAGSASPWTSSTADTGVPGGSLGRQVGVHAQRVTVGVGVDQVGPQLDLFGIGQGMDQRLRRVELCHAAHPTSPAAACSG